MMIKQKCLNVIVLYDNYNEVVKYIRSATKDSYGMVDFIVVVNKDTEGKSGDFPKEFQDVNVTVKDYGDNIGYLNALLYSLDSISFDEYKYIILSNTDIEYVTPNFFEQLLTNHYDPSVGCIAPDVFSTFTKSHSNPHYKKPLSKRRLQRAAFIFSHPILVPLYMKLSELKARKTKAMKQESQYVCCAHGCYFILTSKFAKQLVGKRYPVKMYSEEGWIARNLRNMGLRCFYDSSLTVNHNEHTTTNKLGLRKQAKLFSEALKHELQEFYSDE